MKCSVVLWYLFVAQALDAQNAMQTSFSLEMLLLVAPLRAFVWVSAVSTHVKSHNGSINMLGAKNAAPAE